MDRRDYIFEVLSDLKRHALDSGDQDLFKRVTCTFAIYQRELEQLGIGSPTLTDITKSEGRFGRGSSC